MAEKPSKIRGYKFRKAVESLGLENPIAEISTNIKYDKGNLSKIINNKLQPSKSVVEKFENFYNLKIEDFKYDNFSEEALPVDFNSYMKIPIINHRARAGFLSGWGDPEYIQELPTTLWEVDKEYKGKYVCFEVTGDSMDNNTRESIVENDTLLCREIQRVHWKNKLHLHRWKNFVIVHREEGILIKRVLEHDTETGKLILQSLNPMYEDQTVYMDDLIAIFNVIDIKRSL
ncbi:LexA family transcriptional regulator [Christiangramia forsetii]|nr:XRE family transcriptional regulator [Christiangramia forsetii]